MAKNSVKDSLLLGLKLGDTKQQFFDKCWQLNKDEKVKQGPVNKFVQYNLPLKDSTQRAEQITMLFYGIFNEEKIMTGLDMRFYYEAWALWNESLQSDQLLPVVKDSLMTWFPGNEFIPVTLKKSNKDILVKVDGNRRIIIEPLTDNRQIDARIDDLRYSKGLDR